MLKLVFLAVVLAAVYFGRKYYLKLKADAVALEAKVKAEVAAVEKKL